MRATRTRATVVDTTRQADVRSTRLQQLFRFQADGFIKLGGGQIGVHKDCSLQFGAIESCATQGGTRKVCAGEVGAFKDGSLQVGRSEIGADKRSCRENPLL